MPKARKHQVSLEATPYYHCTSRCVRRAFLCGQDQLTGRSYEHRRKWIEERILQVANAFCVEICAYAVMSNHFHVVLHINQEKAKKLSDREVCKRWHLLFSGTEISQRYCQNDALSKTEREVVHLKAKTWRENLYSISWFMRCINEPIARMANAEDQCTGSFWEARFSSQALLDEKALAACLAYVDLNPIRAKIASSPETSEHTSIKKRIDKLKEKSSQPNELFPFVGNRKGQMSSGLPFTLTDYLNLVHWTAKALLQNEQNSADYTPPQILAHLQFDKNAWLALTSKFESKVRILVGASHNVKVLASNFGYRRSPKLSTLKFLFG